MERIGPYRIVESLGAGGMAHVWRGVAADGHEAAVKVLDAKFARGVKARARFYGEANTMSAVQHEHVVRIYDKGEDHDVLWLAMELLDGGTADLWIRRHGPMPARLAVDVLVAVLRGLEAVHAEGIVHRDIKPSNVLLGSDGRIKITDFGIARADDSELTKTGAMMGTWIYMAPEQRTNAKAVDERADVFSAGGTLWALLTGHDPIDLSAPESIDTLAAPAELVGIVRRALRFNPEDRYPSAAVMRADLEIAQVTLPPVPESAPPLFARLLDEAPQIPHDPSAPPTYDMGPAVRRTTDLPQDWRPQALAGEGLPGDWAGTPKPAPAAPKVTPKPAERWTPRPVIRDAPRSYEIVEPEKTAPVWTPTPDEPKIKKEKPSSSAVPVVVFSALVLGFGVTAAFLLSEEKETQTSAAAPGTHAPAATDTDAETDSTAEVEAADTRPKRSSASPKGRLLVLTPGPASVTIDGQGVGESPVEVAIPPGFHKVYVHEIGGADAIDLHVNVSDAEPTEVCWSFKTAGYCGDAELNAARGRW